MTRTIEIKPISVEFIDKMGSDKRVVNCAKVSFSKWNDESQELTMADKGLLSYLATGLPANERDNWEALAKANTHWTPFAHCFLSIRVNVPFFLARQLHKHTVGLVINECFSADTEVLTEQGWKLWPDVQPNDKLATPKPDGVSYSFERPLSLVEENYSGSLVHAYSRDIDMLVTPNHDQFVSSYNSKGWTKFEKVTTDACRSLLFPKTLPMPELDMEEGEDYLEGVVYGAFIGDGCVSADGERIYFHIKRERKKKFFRELMMNTPEFKWAETEQPDGYSYFRMYNIKGWVGKTSTKEILFYKQTKTFYNGVLEGLICTDGCRQKNGGISYSTVSEPLVRSIETLAYALGFDVKIHTRSHPKWSETYKMLFKKKSSKLLKYFEDVPYSGKVYCAKTSTGLLIVRRNGKSCVSGNCSRRYIKSDIALWLPDVVHKAPDHAKQGASAEEADVRFGENRDTARDFILETSELSVDAYYHMLDCGIAPEEARIVLPLNAMTQWVWSGSLLAFARVYALRKDTHAQGAAQEFAHKLGAILYEHFPYSMKALNYGE